MLNDENQGLAEDMVIEIAPQQKDYALPPVTGDPGVSLGRP